jgi:hypothetical protein
MASQLLHVQPVLPGTNALSQVCHPKSVLPGLHSQPQAKRPALAARQASTRCMGRLFVGLVLQGISAQARPQSLSNATWELTRLQGLKHALNAPTATCASQALSLRLLRTRSAQLASIAITLPVQLMSYLVQLARQTLIEANIQ